MKKVLDYDGLSHYTERILDALAFVHKVTYDELFYAAESDNLQPGRWYAITDYVTTTTQEGTMSDAVPFVVLVQAESENTLNENARAIWSETSGRLDSCNMFAWELKYSIYNDTNRFFWADTDTGKGVIYYMKDEFGNEAPYDFKNIRFIRHRTLEFTKDDTMSDIPVVIRELTALFQNTMNIGLSYDSRHAGGMYIATDRSREEYYYTFNEAGVSGHDQIDISSEGNGTTYKVYNNIIGKTYKNETTLMLPNNVFFVPRHQSGTIPRISDNHLGDNNYDNTFYGKSSIINNFFENNCSENIFVNANNNIFKQNSRQNILIDENWYCRGNIIYGDNNILFSNATILDYDSSYNILLNVSYNYLRGSSDNVVISNHNEIDTIKKSFIISDNTKSTNATNKFIGTNSSGDIKVANIFDFLDKSYFYTVDFLDTTTVIQEINLNGNIKINKILASNVSKLYYTSGTAVKKEIDLTSETQDISINQSAPITWEIERTNAGVAAINVNYVLA